MAVYFIRPIGMTTGPVKIGSSIRPHERLVTYQKVSPYPLELVAQIDGGVDLERRFHAKFVDFHSHHEWFRWSFALQRTIAMINEGSFDVATLPDGRDIRIKGRHTPASIQAGLNHRRIEKLMKAGVAVPEVVAAARWTWGHPPEEVVRRRKVVSDFLASLAEEAA